LVPLLELESEEDLGVWFGQSLTFSVDKKQASEEAYRHKFD